MLERRLYESCWIGWESRDQGPLGREFHEQPIRSPHLRPHRITRGRTRGVRWSAGNRPAACPPDTLDQRSTRATTMPAPAVRLTNKMENHPGRCQASTDVTKLSGRCPAMKRNANEGMPTPLRALHALLIPIAS